MKSNCWEVKKCGRQPGGAKTAELGICPAAQDNQYNNRNHGKCAGRYCWKVAGTLCGGQVQGTFASKVMNCAKCEVYRQVKKEEGDCFQL